MIEQNNAPQDTRGPQPLDTELGRLDGKMRSTKRID